MKVECLGGPHDGLIVDVPEHLFELSMPVPTHNAEIWVSHYKRYSPLSFTFAYQDRLTD